MSMIAVSVPPTHAEYRKTQLKGDLTKDIQMQAKEKKNTSHKRSPDAFCNVTKSKVVDLKWVLQKSMVSALQWPYCTLVKHQQLISFFNVPLTTVLLLNTTQWPRGEIITRLSSDHLHVSKMLRSHLYFKKPLHLACKNMHFSFIFNPWVSNLYHPNSINLVIIQHTGFKNFTNHAHLSSFTHFLWPRPWSDKSR